nr:hypothetical protein [Burkholderia diffusa]
MNAHAPSQFPPTAQAYIDALEVRVADNAQRLAERDVKSDELA